MTVGLKAVWKAVRLAGRSDSWAVEKVVTLDTMVYWMVAWGRLFMMNMTVRGQISKTRTRFR